MGLAPHPSGPRPAIPVIPTPDGTRYFALGAGERVPAPFHRRWLIPYLCRQSVDRWVACTWLSWLTASIAVGMLAPTWQTGVAAAVMFAVLPGIQYNLGAPILVDMPAIAFATCAAVAWAHGAEPAAIILAVLAGCTKESGPVFAAAFAWNPWLLVGLAASAVRSVFWKACPAADDPLNQYRSVTPPEEHRWILEHPFQAGLKYHAGKWADATTMLAPWGGALAALGNVTPQLVVVVLLGYAQLLVATDTVRLYQWAAPIVCVAATTAVPVAWLPLLVALTVWNPHAGNGV